jgi:REP element-mobilizing transposase RayT
MANTYTQLYVHVIFAVKGRSNLLSKNLKPVLYSFIAGIFRSQNQKLMIINGTGDHVHILIGLRPDSNLSDFIRELKSNSSRWINENGFLTGKFEWQRGFGAFSVGPNYVKTVINYIKGQEEHHRKRTFREEYVDFLESYEIEFKREFIFDEFNNSTEC